MAKPNIEGAKKASRELMLKQGWKFLREDETGDRYINAKGDEMSVGVKAEYSPKEMGQIVADLPNGASVDFIMPNDGYFHVTKDLEGHRNIIISGEKFMEDLMKPIEEA